MSLFIHSLQLLERGVGVDFRRTDALMSQQVLDSLKARAVVEHCRGKGVTQHVGRLLFHGGDGRQVLPNNQVDLITRHPLSFVAQEQGAIRFAELILTHRHVVLQFCGEFFPEGYDALFVPLSRHFQLAGTKIDVLVIQSYQF